MSGPVIYLVRSWPRLSQTFIVNEVLALERRGVDLVLFSLVRSGEPVVQPQVAEVRTAVSLPRDRMPLDAEPATSRCSPRAARRYLPRCPVRLRAAEISHPATATAPARVLPPRRPGGGRRRPTPRRRPGTDPSARALRPRPGAGRHAGTPPRRGLPFSFTGHARDLVQIPRAQPRGSRREAHHAGHLLRGQRRLHRRDPARRARRSRQGHPPRRRARPVQPRPRATPDARPRPRVGRASGREEGLSTTCSQALGRLRPQTPDQLSGLRRRTAPDEP